MVSFDSDSFSVDAFSEESFDLVESVMNPVLLGVFHAVAMMTIMKKKT